MTAVLAPPMGPRPAAEEGIVTLENLRAVSRSRSLGLGIASIVFALLCIVGFGLRTPSGLESTIDFGSTSSAPSVPSLSSAMQVVVGVLGAGLLIVGIVLLARRRRRKVLGVSAMVAGALLVAWPVALACGVNSSDGTMKTLTVPVAASAYLLGGIALVLGILLVAFRFSRGAYGILYISIACFVLEFLIWIARGSNTGAVVPLALSSVLAASFFSATPLMYGSLSGVMCERSGVVNIAIEGMFMFGAMSAAMVTSIVGNSTEGFVAGTVVAGALGGILGVVLAYMALHFRANQIIVGVVIVAFCTAMVQFMMSQVLDTYQSLNQGYGTLPIAIPGLSRIPIIGPILFDQSYFVYLAIALVALVNFVLFRTKFGLRVRSVGEKPKASETVGLNVLRIRYVWVVLGGVVAGIGGAVFTIGEGIPMGVGITGGEGFIALAIMIFGRWRPWGAFWGTMLFGFTIALGSQLQLYLAQLVIPTELISALPYIITIAAVAGLVGRVRPPASDGIPYSRE